MSCTGNKEKLMTYYFSRTIRTGSDEAVSRITKALKKEGFGILTGAENDYPECMKGRTTKMIFYAGRQETRDLGTA